MTNFENIRISIKYNSHCEGKKVKMYTGTELHLFLFVFDVICNYKIILYNMSTTL